MPYRGELDEVRPLFHPGCRVLELGAGTGRMTRRMMEWRCHVTAVDSSAEMLAELPSESVAIEADIEKLRLGTAFDVILLASNLINHPSPTTRESFVRTARHHAAIGSRFLLERHDPAWLNAAQVGALGTANGVSMAVEAISRADALVTMTLRYESDGKAWRQSFSTQGLNEAAVERVLALNGFGSFSWFGPGRRWVQAVAVADGET